MLGWNVDEEEHLEKPGGLRERSRDGDTSGWPHGLYEITETAISGGGPGPVTKEK